MIKLKNTIQSVIDNHTEESKYVYFWGKSDRESGIDTAVFSNWHIAPFIAFNDVQFTSVEQAMMSWKAILHCDHEAVEYIMNTDNPFKQKKRGREVINFDPELWDAVKVHYVYEACLAKFSQNEREKQALLSTGDAVIVEASPHDKIWGIGLHEKEQEALDPNNWRGENLLGFVLMEVRENLK